MPGDPQGPWKGPRDPRSDYFDDIMGDNQEAGIFNSDHGEGITDYDKLHVTRDKTGIHVNAHLGHIHSQGRGDLDVTWGELYVISQAPATGVLPPGWHRSEVNQAAYHEVFPSVVVSPDWAAKELQAAVRARLITEQEISAHPVVRQLQQFMQARAQQ